MEQKVKTKKVSGKRKVVDKKSVSKNKKPTFEQIQQRAYQIYMENGYKGSEMENWLRAENELK